MDEIAGIGRSSGVSRLEEFGSAARGVDFDPDTGDANFLVRFRSDDDVDPPGKFFDLVDALSGAQGRPVDLVEERAARARFSSIQTIDPGNRSMRRDGYRFTD